MQRRNKQWVWIAVALLAAGLSGCTKKLGDSHPPKAYGVVETPWVGCPQFKHAYAWPPIAGEVYREDANPMQRKYKKLMGVTLYGPSELVIGLKQTQVALTFKVHGLRSEGTASAKGPGWSQAINELNTWGCSGGYLWVDEEAVDGTMDAGDRAAPRLFIAPLKDGSLAMGQRTIYPSTTEHLFSFGNFSAIPFPTRPTEVWVWSHLKSIPMADLDAQ
jgi:hypothetical protein